MLSSANIIAVDCEGVDLGRPTGVLCLLQIADGTDVYLFDMMEPGVVSSPELRDLMSSSSSMKLLHDCRADVAALYAHGIELRQVIDTQVVAAHLQYGGEVGLDSFLKEVTGSGHPLKSSAPHKQDPRAWTHRPLPGLSCAYAAADVRLLFDAFTKLQDSKCFNRTTLEQIITESDGRVEMAETGALGTSHAPVDGSLVDAFIVASQPVERDVHPVNVELNIEQLLSVLPDDMRAATEVVLEDEALLRSLTDICVDVDHDAYIRCRGRGRIELNYPVTQEDLDHIVDQVETISDSHRACITASLHRASFIWDPDTTEWSGVTIRAARQSRGIANYLADLLLDTEEQHSFLLIGAPGAGKTTMLRDIARLMAEPEHGRSVLIVDTSNEIAGEGRGHDAVGCARRIKCGSRKNQHHMMLEAVQNHTPDVLIVDEISTMGEAKHCADVAERGVSLVATTHGSSFANVALNGELSAAFGGARGVILSANECERDGVTSKNRVEREKPPAFDVCIEMRSPTSWRIIRDVGRAVDAIRQGTGEVVPVEIREVDPTAGTMVVRRGVFPDRHALSRV
jgi:stage III sporulation protein SpoIIIAA